MQKVIYLLIILTGFATQAQTIFSDTNLPQAPHVMPAPYYGQIWTEKFSLNSDGNWPTQLQQQLDYYSKMDYKGCDTAETYDYAVSLTVKGQFSQCLSYVEKCLAKNQNLDIPTVIQGARCGKLSNQYERTRQLFSQVEKLPDFKGDLASALVLEYALFTQYTIYQNQTDTVIAQHPAWSQADRADIKALVEFLGKNTPTLKRKDEVFAFLDQQISKSTDNFYKRLLLADKVGLLLNEYRVQEAYDFLAANASEFKNPLDWWPLGFQSLYRLTDNADFSKAIGFYKSFIPFANAKSTLPLEQNVYTYTQISSATCSRNMLKGTEAQNLKSLLQKWKDGQLSLQNLIKNLENNKVQTSQKSDLLSAYAGLLVINSQLDKAREYYWKAHQACPFNNRSHWGLVLLDRKERYASYPEYSSNIERLKQTISQIQLPASVSSYFIDWNSLPEASHQRITYGSRIWVPFMKDLEAANYRVYIKMPFELLSEAPGFSSIRDTRIGPPDMPSYKLDNRLWDDVRGAGGQFVIADHDETFETVQGDYNLLGHEMAHQFHAYVGVTKPDLANCIEKLYAQAQKKNTFPDAYAATNSKEYFAQGITYFLIPADSPARFGVTSAWYPQHDPDLYSFMISIQNSNGDLNSIKCPL